MRHVPKFTLMLCALVLPTAAQAAGPPAPFRHIIIIVQENRTPDNLFGSNPTFEHGVDLATSGLNSRGQQIPLSGVS